MNKKELVQNIAEKSDMTQKDISKIIDACFSEIIKSLAEGNSVQIIGFGSFSVFERSARDGRNPSTGKPMHIPAKKNVHFKNGNGLKMALNKT